MKEKERKKAEKRGACCGPSRDSSCCGSTKGAPQETLTPGDLFSQLGPWLDKERCRTCDCLQGALAQIEIDGDDELREKAARHVMTKDEMHPCLGCKPCPPAEYWVQYLSSHGPSS